MAFLTARAGDRGTLLRFDAIGVSELAACATRARARAEIEAAVPGWTSLLLVFRDGTAPNERAAIASEIAAARETGAALAGASHEIPVSFAEGDAPDLPLLLEKTGISRAELLDRIARLELRARVLGFRPGFAYLEGLPAGWELPRRETPRRNVPAGSFAVAGEKAAFYPSASPGGWNLLGRTNARLWDPDRDPPNLIAPGDRIRIVPAGSFAPDAASAPPSRRDDREVLATVLHPGTASFVVAPRDPGRLVWGMPSSGPFDAYAASRANRNVGNADEAPLLECALSGPRLLCSTDLVASWCGAAAEVRVEGRVVADHRVMRVRLGEILEIGPLREGARGYLAVRSGFAHPSPRELPRRIEKGELLFGGDAATGPSRISDLARRAPRTIRALIGPDEVPPRWSDLVREREWEVTPESDRSAVRLTGGVSLPDLPRELPSSGMQFGTVQWHPDGDLVAMGPDHPVTGGYLQPFTIVSAELWKLAQLRPGDRIRWEVS